MMVVKEVAEAVVTTEIRQLTMVVEVVVVAQDVFNRMMEV